MIGLAAATFWAICRRCLRRGFQVETRPTNTMLCSCDAGVDTYDIDVISDEIRLVERMHVKRIARDVVVLVRPPTSPRATVH